MQLDGDERNLETAGDVQGGEGAMAPASPVAEEAAAAQETPAAAPPKGEAEEGGFDFAAGVADLRAGDIVRGHVVEVHADTVLVDVGYKSEGVIPLNEYTYRHVADAHEVARVGDEIEAMVLSLDREEGTLRLSRRRAEEARAWGRLKQSFEEGEVLEVPVVEAVKGGLVCDVGTRGFLPASQVERGYANDLQKYVGERVRVKIIELDRAKHRVILSRRVVLEEERQRAREETWARLEEGAVVEGTVKSLTDFGAFIDLGGVDGLLHVSEMSWGRVGHPSEVLREGERVRVQVLRLDRERDRISLGLRQVLANPWDDVERRYPVDSIHEGRVVRLANFGAFVELEPGIDGLVHVSELSDHRVSRPSEVVAVGDPVTVQVLRVSPAERRVSLTMRGVRQTGAFEATDLRKRPPAAVAPAAGGGEAYTIGDAVRGGERSEGNEAGEGTV
jgi:4-hydroxy-3-methylbut-2-enyl diphosphate reductase